MAEEIETKSSSSFPFFKLLSLLSVVYLVLIALEVNIPFLNMISQKYALLGIAAIFFFNILTGGGEGHIRDFKRKMAKEWKK